MNRYLRIVLMLVVLGGALAFSPAASEGQDYWNSYWGWYDRSYRPYYNRRYRYDYGYRGYPRYYSYPYYGGGYRYGYPYYGGYYGYYPNQVQIGPFGIGWR